MAKFDALFGGSYQSQSAMADQERTINFYPEVLQVPGATSKLALYPTPGVQIIGEVPHGGGPFLGPGYGRGHYSLDGVELLVVGDGIYVLTAAGLVGTVHRTLPIDQYPATIHGNGRSQFLVTSGGNAVLYNNITGLTALLPTLNGLATMGGYLDGRFLVLNAVTGTLYISAVFDGYTWATGTDFARRTLAPDPWRGMKVVGRYIWLFGEHTTEIWQDVGANFPFAPFPSSLLPYGTAAPHSAALVGNGVAWMANTAAGRRCVVYASGQNPEIISTYPLESVLSKYGDVTTAVGDSYSDKGHTFYMLSIDEEPEVTFVWDLETRLWHERGTWQPKENRYEAWRPRFYAFAHGEHRILDKAGPRIYRMSTDLEYDVDGLAIRRMRRAPAIQNENQRVFYSSLELDVEHGLGLTRDGRETRPTMASFSMVATEGKLAVVGAGYWSTDGAVGFPGFNGHSSGADTTFQADSRRTLQAIVYWLTGMAAGADILIAAPTAAGNLFGSQLQDALTAAGHTFDVTDAYSFTGFDPLAYDAFFVPQGIVSTDAPYATHNFIWCMDYILSNGGKILSECSGASSPWSVYGFAAAQYHYPVAAPAIHASAGAYGPPNWKNQRPFACAAFGDPGIGGSWSTGYYAVALHTSHGLRYASPPANSRGGTSTVYACPLAASGIHGSTYDNLGILGLWTP